MRHFIVFFFILSCFCASAQKNIQLLDRLQFEEGLTDIWGYSDNQGNEYALIGAITGVYIVDVSDPTQVQTVAFIPGDTAEWRDIKTHGNYLYGVSDGAGSGLLIADLSGLPNEIDHFYTTTEVNFTTAHNIFIDEQGWAYVVGADGPSSGAYIFDLSQPENPVLLGSYDRHYVHDAYARDQVLYTAEINDGLCAIFDVSDPANPRYLTDFETPNRFTHNVWLDSSGRYLATTDEKADAFVAVYDISELDNIELLDKIQSFPGSRSVPHNAFWQGQHIVTSYYRNGLRVYNASRPNNLVEVAYYDTHPALPGDGFQGNWGVYPYFESGTVVASDRSEGLFVFNIDYAPAAYLEGTISDASTGLGLANAFVEIMGSDQGESTLFGGAYTTGTDVPGRYDIRVTRPGCKSTIITQVPLQLDSISVVDVALEDCELTGISAFEAIDVQLQPNPSRDYMELRSSDWTAFPYVSVWSAQGQKIDQLQWINGRIDYRHDLPAGQYFLLLQNDHESRSEVFSVY